MKIKLLFLLLFTALLSFAQNPADIAQRFGPAPGIGNGNCIAIQPDGKIILGNAGYYQGIPIYGLIRLNPDGSKDTSFNIGTGFSGGVYSIALQSDGKIIVGGNFTSYKGVTQNCLIRLNTDGSKDTSFNIGTGFFKLDNINFINSAYIKSIVLQSNGQLIVSGGFTKYQGVNQNHLIRLNANGSKDSSFNIGTGFDSTAESIALQTNGQLIVGGNFTKYQDTDQKRLIRLNTDGSKDTSFVIGTGFNNIVNSIKLQSDGKIIVGGGFTIYNSSSQECLIRLNLDGTIDPSFKIGTRFYYGAYPNDPAVYSIFLQLDGKIIVGGKFDSYQGNNNSLTRLNADGSKDSNFDIETGFNSNVNSIALQPDGKIMVSGNFDKYQGVNQKGVIRLNPNGEKDTSFNLGNGFTDSVRSITLQSDGKILVGGQFSSYQETSQNRLIRFNPDGNKDTTFNIGTGFNQYDWTGDCIVQAITLQPDGKIIVGGIFDKYTESTQRGLVRLKSNGSIDETFDTGNGFWSDYPPPYYTNVNVISLQSNGKIIVGGSFSRYQGISYNNLIRLNSNGSIDTSFQIGTGFNGSIESIILQPDGKILIGGAFSSYQGIATNGLIRLNTDGSKDTTFIVASGFDDAYALALQSDGKIVVGGTRNPSYHVYFRLNTDGSIDNSFGTGINSINRLIRSIIIQTDGKIILGGSIDNNLIRLNSDGSKDTTFNIGTGFNNSTSTSVIYSLALQPDGQILAGGFFDTYQGDNQSVNLIRLKGTYVATPINTATIQTNMTCGITGSASVSVYGGKSPYYYLWSNGATTPTITKLTAGNYSCTITDADSSTVTKNFVITTTADTQKPTITAPPSITINTNSDCSVTGIALGTPITADNCTVSSVTNNAPTTYPTGNTTVTWTVKDASNNTATATQIVTVKESILPTINAPAAITVNTTSNCIATGILLGTAITTDNCSVVSVTNNAPTTYPLGSTTVTWTVKDASNNTATATQIVTVKDITKPTITAPPTVIVNADSNGTATGVVLGTPITADNCSVSSVTNNAPTTFPLGNTTVTWTVKDASNNTATATQTVTIKDAAPTTLIPDINFEKKLIALGIDSGVTDGKVLTSKIASLTSLTISNSLISDLTGIQDFVALKDLYCVGNLLTTLDISKNTALINLNCTGNKLSILDVSKNVTLTNLECGLNQLTTIDVSKNIALTNLNLDTNQLTTIDLSKNIALTNLNCDLNQLTSLDISKNVALTNLQCSSNKLTNLDVTKNTALIYLYCYSNKLSSLDVSKNIVLTGLQCFSNQLTSLDVSKNVTLNNLYCNSNQLISFNLKNGKNTLLGKINFTNNPNLSCIQVDNTAYSNTNWTNAKDITASYSEDCREALVLPSNNFTIESKGESCLNQNNGEINITAKANYNYVANINGTKYPLVNNSLKISSLAPAIYNVSITITGELFEQNFTVTIPKGATITAKSTVTSRLASVEITEGTAPYTVFVNGEEQFETASDTFSIEVNKGDFLEVKTAKVCEGIYLKEINTDILESVLAHPNPTNGKFDIEIPIAIKEIVIDLYTMDSKIISKETYTPINGRVPINIENQASGVYIAKIYLDQPKYLKIIKK